jgi:hypothetical protein
MWERSAPTIFKLFMKQYFEQNYGDGPMGYCDNPRCYCHSNIIVVDVWVPIIDGKPRYTHWPKSPLTRWQKFKLFIYALVTQ